MATYWTTIAAAAAAPAGQAAHYCQGYEGQIAELNDRHAAIAEAYRTPLPCIVVSPFLAELVGSRFGRPCRVVPPSVSPLWHPRLRLAPHRPARIVVVGHFEFPLKGVRTALGAVRRLREGGLGCHLIRIAQWPQTAEERATLAADEYHQLIVPDRVAGIFRGADLLLAPSREGEGFGLPLLEALASGLPAVASNISSHRGFAATAAALVPGDDTEAFAREARAILLQPARWRRMRRLGVAAARRFAAGAVADDLERAMTWVAERQWAKPPPGDGSVA